jgi:hypothetical protein
MTYDTGFAPNPYHGVLTLATCKPVIRRCAKVGDWIAGWTANNVHDKDGNVIDFRDNQKLIYLAKIDEVMPLKEYWEKYKDKRPHKIGGSSKNAKGGCSNHGTRSDNNCSNYDSGDNIYEWNGNEYIQHPNRDHEEKDRDHDISGINALICKEFYYFGVNNAEEISDEYFDYVNKIPRSKKISLCKCKKFIEHVQSIKNVTISSKHPQ